LGKLFRQLEEMFPGHVICARLTLHLSPLVWGIPQLPSVESIPPSQST